MRTRIFIIEAGADILWQVLKSTKAAYFDKLKTLLETYKSIFIVTVDNVSSQQMHEIRISLRGEG